MAAAAGEEQELLTQRLKAAVHYTVGCLCQAVEEDKDVQFSKQSIAAISEITFRQCGTAALPAAAWVTWGGLVSPGLPQRSLSAQEPSREAQGFKNNSTELEIFAKDLEMFARHAKRTTVNTEDVKLLARRSNSLLKYITQKSEELASSNMEHKKKKKKSSAAKGETTPEEQEAAVTENEDSNMA